MMDKVFTTTIWKGFANSGSQIPVKYLQLRRVAELFSIIIVSPIILAFIILISILLFLSDKGPIFFIQKRPGKGGKMFYLYKFRTMYRDAGNQQLTTKGDKRVTRTGKFLRRSKLDELPQLLNVLKGDMSLIGPRPVPENFYQTYLIQIPSYDLRHTIRPGLTGLSQVRLGYTETLEEEKQKLLIDLEYIKRLGPAMDLRIMRDTLLLPFNKKYKSG